MARLGSIRARGRESRRKSTGPDPLDMTVKYFVGVFGELEPLDLVLAIVAKMQTSTRVALAEKTAKFVPRLSAVAPRGYGLPSLIRIYTPRGWACRPPRSANDNAHRLGVVPLRSPCCARYTPGVGSAQGIAAATAARISLESSGFSRATLRASESAPNSAANMRIASARLSTAAARVKASR